MRTPALFGAAALCLAAAGCGDLSQKTNLDNPGTLDINVWITKPRGHAKARRASETSWQRLILRVSGEGMDTLRDTLATTMGEALYQRSLAGVTPGDDRLVEAWTESGDGLRIHEGSAAVSRLDPGEVETVTLALDPLRGSIYIALADVPTTVDSVFACFTWTDGAACDRRARGGLMDLTIDNVPDGADGQLVITAVSAPGDTLYEDTTAFVFDAGVDASLRSRFSATPGELTTEVSLARPGVTVVSGFMDSADSTGPELGPLIVSEIMYYAVGDSDYIEIHNPTASAVVLDTLVLEVVETSSRSIRYILDVNVPPGGYLVIGDSDAPRDDAAWNIDTTVVYNLTTTGRWIRLRARRADGSMGTVDWVAYSGYEGQGWPERTSRYAIELDSLPEDPEYNNYGRNWVLATQEIGGSGHYGTPGS